VDRRRYVRVAAEGTEDRPADHERVEGGGEGRYPAECPLPCHPGLAQSMRDAVDFDGGRQQRVTDAVEKPGIPGELDGSARSTVDDTDGSNRSVRGMNARERQPVVAGR